MDRRPGRREVLLIAGTAGAAALAAACTGGSSSSTSSTSSAPPRPVRSTTPSGAPTTGRSSPVKPPSTSPGAGRPLPVGSGPPPRYGSRTAYAALARQMTGPLARPGQARYQPAALLYNPRFATAHRPDAIAYCESVADVAACVRFAADSGTPLRMRNGGHSYGGWSSGPGVVANLAAMNHVRVDHAAMTARIGAGALLADVYSELGAAGVSIGAGSCATVGVTGLTLGGGIGLLTRSYGLTCDQLEAASVVTADGTTTTVSAEQHPDLFWALRGGGGSFAAVTSLTFRVRPAPRVRTTLLQWPGSDAGQVLAAWQQWARHTPRQLWSTCKVLARPGEGMRAVVFTAWTGPGTPDRQLRRLLRDTPRPSVNSPSYDTYAPAMLAAAGCYGSARSCIVEALTPAQRLPEAAASSIMQNPLPQQAIRSLVHAVRAGLDVPGMSEGGASFDVLGGAVSDVGVQGTAFPWRTALADVQYTATWSYDRATVDPGRYDRFVHRLRSALLPYVGAFGYANYADPSLRDYAQAYWGLNLPRLRAVKRRYDPHGVFSFPQSVPL